MGKTIWVSTLAVDNSGDGLTYATAKKNLYEAITSGDPFNGAAAISAIGDTINIVNDGIHDDVSPTNVAVFKDLLGTDWSNPGIIIRGTDSSGNKAMATVGVAAGYTGSWVWSFFFGTTDYVIIEGIKFDMSGANNASTRGAPFTYIFKYFDDNKKIVDCEFWFTSGVGSGQSLANGFISIFNEDSIGTNGSQKPEISGCLFVNIPFISIGAGAANSEIIFHHNVMIFDASDYPSGSKLLALTYDGTPTDGFRTIYNNTFFIKSYGADKTPPAIVSSSDDGQWLKCHSNMIFVECSPTVLTPGVSGLILTGYNASTVISPVLMGYDLIVIGPNLTVFYNDGSWDGASPGISSYQFNENFQLGLSPAGTDVYRHSNLFTGTIADNAFADTASTYSWIVSGSDYSHTIPMDLRPKNAFGLGYLATTPGALPPVLDPLPPDEGEDISYPAVIDSLPFYRPVLKINLSVMSRIDRNRIIGHSDARHFLTDKHYDEDVSRIFTIAASSSSGPVYLSGVNKARVIMIETDQTVTFTIHTATQSFVVVVDELIVLDNSDVMYFEAANSGSTEATIKFLAVQ